MYLDAGIPKMSTSTLCDFAFSC